MEFALLLKTNRCVNNESHYFKIMIIGIKEVKENNGIVSGKEVRSPSLD